MTSNISENIAGSVREPAINSLSGRPDVNATSSGCASSLSMSEPGARVHVRRYWVRRPILPTM